MAHIKTAQDGSQKISLSTPEWIRVGIQRGFLEIDPRVAEHGRKLAEAAGIDPDKATYTTLKRAMQTPEIMERLSQNMEEHMTKTAQYYVPQNATQQVGQDTGGPGWGTAALGTAGLAATAPLAFQSGRDWYKNVGRGLANAGASSSPHLRGLGTAFSRGFSGAGRGLAPTFSNVARGVGAFAGKAALPALGLAGGALASYFGIKGIKALMKGPATPSPQFAGDPQVQNNVMVAIDRFNKFAPALQGMSSSIDEHINAVGAAVTDTIQSMQTAGDPTAVSPQFQSEDQERAAQIAAMQQQIAEAQAANQRFMAGPRIPAPAGLAAPAAPVAPPAN